MFTLRQYISTKSSHVIKIYPSCCNEKLTCSGQSSRTVYKHSRRRLTIKAAETDANEGNSNGILALSRIRIRSSRKYEQRLLAYVLMILHLTSTYQGQGPKE